MYLRQDFLLFGKHNFHWGGHYFPERLYKVRETMTWFPNLTNLLGAYNDGLAGCWQLLSRVRRRLRGAGYLPAALRFLLGLNRTCKYFAQQWCERCIERKKGTIGCEVFQSRVPASLRYPWYHRFFLSTFVPPGFSPFFRLFFKHGYLDQDYCRPCLWAMLWYV